ncbi:MAG: hypothetical protein ACX930_02790 [Erythrobacter sp.]
MLSAGPLAAQSSTEQAGTSASAFTPEEDLDCAIYIGAIMAETAAEMTPESRVALTSAFTYFIGRYEAQSGMPLAQALAERYPRYVEGDANEIEQTCTVRARGFAVRMQDAGRLMAEAQSQSEAEPDLTPSE